MGCLLGIAQGAVAALWHIYSRANRIAKLVDRIKQYTPTSSLRQQ